MTYASNIKSAVRRVCPKTIWRLLSATRQGKLAEELGALGKERSIRQLEMSWQMHKREGKPFRYQLTSQIKMELYPDDRLSELIFKRGFETDERVFITRYLKTGDMFVDVGANIGLYTLIAAGLVGASGRVYAFEPCGLTYERLTRNVQINGFTNVYPIRAALSDRKELRVLTISADGYMAWSSLAQPTAGAVFVQETVESLDWDAFAAQAGVLDTIALMKIDVEGWELRVLTGAASALVSTSAPDLLVEFTEANARSAGASCSQVYMLLDTYGYRMYSIDAARRALTKVPLREYYPHMNILATKRLNHVCKRTGFRVDTSA